MKTIRIANTDHEAVLRDLEKLEGFHRIALPDRIAVAAEYDEETGEVVKPAVLAGELRYDVLAADDFQTDLETRVFPKKPDHELL